MLPTLVYRHGQTMLPWQLQKIKRDAVSTCDVIEDGIVLAAE